MVLLNSFQHLNELIITIHIKTLKQVTHDIFFNVLVFIVVIPGEVKRLKIFLSPFFA